MFLSNFYSKTDAGSSVVAAITRNNITFITNGDNEHIVSLENNVTPVFGYIDYKFPNKIC